MLNVNSENKGGLSSLYYAATKGHMDIVKTLLGCGRTRPIVTRIFQKQVLEVAIRGHDKIVDLLLQEISSDEFSGTNRAETLPRLALMEFDEVDFQSSLKHPSLEVQPGDLCVETASEGSSDRPYTEPSEEEEEEEEEGGELFPADVKVDGEGRLCRSGAAATSKIRRGPEREVRGDSFGLRLWASECPYKVSC
ncbi:hypothetical protein BDW68DRAFT_14962 [Aspergillus falconensis]